MSVLSWSHYPRNIRPGDWVAPLLAVAGDQLTTISSLEKNGPDSDGVLKQLAPGLTALGYTVETSKRREDRVRRPVLFGAQGHEDVSYEVDAFHDGLGIAVEVEAGRGAQNNADYRDLIRAALIVDAKYFALFMPARYRFAGAPTGGVKAYDNSRNMLEAIYASRRLVLPFEGVLLIGY